ncbi:pirin family protein [Poritiphilus flavus]|uniref:Pirin family protein n=1 Tax=Poritiphilus flavus TaxID=2697053 RepID=A0A6L9EDX2_9FLAO|nr:pirin family protein [Poritiphilus flavus]NAS12954.1 pirin family protein [Poritiphilus flavus]
MNSAVKRIFPLGFPWETQDPFLFCVYHLDHYPKGNEEMEPAVSLEGRNLGNDFVIKDGWRMYHGLTVPGFPAHPHRGFETITIVNKGFCDHSDSLGAAGRFGEGDVQWMTAGRGVQHSEMFPLLQTERDNPLELFQIWLNLPAQSKFADPHFKMLWHEDIPVLKEDGASLKLIAGAYQSTEAPAPAPDSWAANPENQVSIWNLLLDPNATFSIPAAAGVNRTLYYYEGDKAQLLDEQISVNTGIELHPEHTITLKNGDRSSGFLLLEGKPIAEPVAKYGPFVMNTQKEIQQAMEEYRITQFGGWPWPHHDNVHDKSEGRFARYPDGNEVRP